MDRAIVTRNSLSNNRAAQYGRAISGRTYVAVAAPDLQSAIFAYTDPPKYTLDEVYKLYEDLSYQSEWDARYWVSAVLSVAELPEILQRDIAESTLHRKDGETREQAYWARLLKAEIEDDYNPKCKYEVLKLCKALYGPVFAAEVLFAVIGD